MTSSYQRLVILWCALIESRPEGVRFIDLREHALRKIPDFNPNTLSGALNRFRNDLPEGVVRPVRGFFITKDAWARRDKKKPVPQRVSPNRDKR